MFGFMNLLLQTSDLGGYKEAVRCANWEHRLWHMGDGTEVHFAGVEDRQLHYCCYTKTALGTSHVDIASASILVNTLPAPCALVPVS